MFLGLTEQFCVEMLALDPLLQLTFPPFIELFYQNYELRNVVAML